MSSSRGRTNGISKQSKGKQRDADLELVEQAAIDGSLDPKKAASAADQVRISDSSSRREQPADAGRQGQSSSQAGYDSHEQSSSANHEAPTTTVKANHNSDVDMDDVGSVSGDTAEAPSTGGGRQGVASTLHTQRDDSPQNHGDDASEADECLGRLDPLPDPPSSSSSNNTPINDDIIDGWGTCRGSTFVIIQCGPHHAAKYRFEYRPNYKHDEMDNISDQEVRISSLRDRDSSGKKSWRYSRHNVEGIYGMTPEERSPYKKYKTDPALWVKIKWKDLKPQDQAKLVRGCSWIPRSEFTRFCGGKRAAELKLKEFWDKQETRDLKFLEGKTGIANDDRSPSPCPLGPPSNGSLPRRSTHLTALDTGESAGGFRPEPDSDTIAPEWPWQLPSQSDGF